MQVLDVGAPRLRKGGANIGSSAHKARCPDRSIVLTAFASRSRLAAHAMETSTISNVFVRSAVAALRSDPVRIARVFAAAGLSTELLEASHARVPAERFSALWLAVAQELDDEFLGLDSRRMKLGTFGVLCRGLMHAGRLERALQQCLRGFATVFDDIAAELSVANNEARLRIANRGVDPARRVFATELFLVILHGVICWLAGRRIPFARATFDFAEPAHSVEYHVMFCSDLHFEAPYTEVSFDARYLACPLVQDEAGLKRFLRDAPQSVFMKYKNTDGWAARVRRRLRKSNGANWPTLEALAVELHVTTSTLRRRLEGEGLTYRELKDGLRRDKAIDLLCGTNLSIEAIASDLGYQEVSAFYRAFRHWTGTRPGCYRHDALGPSASAPVRPHPARAATTARRQH
jgi:AraC-like DNA-binding protein